MSSIKVGDLKVHYNAPRGLPTLSSDPILLLVHGAGGSSRHWEPMIAKLGEGIFPVAIDLPGHGATDGYVPDSLDAVAAFLAAFLDELKVKRPVCYVGQSMGGLIGLQFTLAYPDRVERLVLMATAARIQLHPDFLQQALTKQWDLTLLRQSFAPEVPENLKELVLSEFQHTRVHNDASDFMGVSLIDLSNAISALRLPTLIITGDDDVIISPRKSSVLHRQISGSRLVTVPGAGHYLHVEKSAKVAEEVMHFLRSGI
jgi:pimeloyl-ACP methyl ester carboxylesterase